MDGISLISLIGIFYYGLSIAFVLGLILGMFGRALYWILGKERSKR